MCWNFSKVKIMKQLILALFFAHCAKALDASEVSDALNEDCKPFLTKNNENNSRYYKEIDGFSVQNNDTANFMCPPWYYSVLKSRGSCKQGNNFSSIVIFQPRTGQTYLQTLYCMTSVYDETGVRADVIGSCLLSFDNRLGTSYYPLPCNVSELNDYMCAGLNREGQLCGHCAKGFAPPVFSYSMACVNCTANYRLNWLKYIGVAFGPLTLFCLFICFFHVSASSPYLHGFVFYCQILSMTTLLRMAVNTHGYKEVREGTKFGQRFYISLMSIWNLDIFLGFYEPFCLHPNMTIVQALALDYVIAFYPLCLLLIAYFLIKLHSRNVKLVVVLWKPFEYILRPCVRHINIQTSLIESFATLYFLSAVKIQSVSIDLLSPTLLYFPNGTISQKPYLNLAGDVEYFGTHHLIYGLLVLVLLIIFTLIPGLLLLLYPCRFFQQFLNKINWNSLALRTFVEVFQGNYKDGTNNTRDYRFFSGVFFLNRFVLMATFVLLNSLYSVMIFGTILTLLGFAVATLHPQKTKLHYGLDCAILLFLSLLFFTLIAYFVGSHNSIASQVARYYGYKWKIHFYEMKGDVGMSVHEKERKQEDAYTKTQTHS